MAERYETHATGLRILPGQWRPHYPWEHIAWVSPPWPSQDYVWLDFPEAIFTSQGLLFLSHINPSVPAVYPDWPRVAWDTLDDGVSFRRELPNGVSFGGSVMRDGGHRAALTLYLVNGSPDPLANITLQTCCFLRACAEFADYSMTNKFVHLPDRGWVSFPEAIETEEERGHIKLGWRGGRALADAPVMACVSNQADRLIAMTWDASTLSLIGNSAHPCLHADPFFPDLDPGKRAEITGALVFHEGPLASFDPLI